MLAYKSIEGVELYLADDSVTAVEAIQGFSDRSRVTCGGVVYAVMAPPATVLKDLGAEVPAPPAATA